MNSIHLYIIAAIPITFEGMKNLLRSNKKIKTLVYFDNFNDALKLVDEKSAGTLLIDDSCIDKNEVSIFIKQVLLISPKTKIILYTDYEDATYLKPIINMGIKGILHKRAAKTEIIEAIELVSMGGFYLDRLVNFAIFKHFLTSTTEHFAKVNHLSKREFEVIGLISKGLKNQEIAGTLFISRHTVEVHKANLLKKLNLKSTAELTCFAVLNRNELDIIIKDEILKQ